MADHVRQQLRAALATRLTGLATTGSRVHGYRVHPLQVSELPALAIHVVREAVAPGTVHTPALIDRDVEVRVMGMASAVTAPDDTLDLIAKEVETALASALTVAGKSVAAHYRGCEISFEDGEKAVGVIDMEFSVRLFNAANAPDVLS